MSHKYPKGEYILPSVTTIIGEYSSQAALMQWASNCTRDYFIANWEYMLARWTGRPGKCFEDYYNESRFEYKRLSEKAMKIGTEVHDILEKIYTDRVIYESDDPNVNNCVSAFEKFVEDHDVVCIKTEHTVYGDYWAGTLDLECELDEVHTILDYKTSARIYPDSMGMQLAAYLSCTKAKSAGVLRLDKETGEYELKIFTKKMLTTYLKRFKKRVELYFTDHPQIAKKAGYRG